jgi:hypothetical protein
MLVNFKDKREPIIFYRQDYSDISPILSLVKSKASVSIFLDPEGEERVIGRFHQCEYTIEINNYAVRESLSVSIDCDENTVKYLKQ